MALSPAQLNALWGGVGQTATKGTSIAPTPIASAPITPRPAVAQPAVAMQPTYSAPVQAPAPVAAAQPQAGVVPITTEPLHPYEKAGLQTIGNMADVNPGMLQALDILKQMQVDPQAFASKYLNPQASEYMTAAGDATKAALNPITLEEVQGVANPFTEALKARLSESGAKARAALSAQNGMRGARSFGDTSQGIREGAIDAELLNKENDIDYQGFEDAKSLLTQLRDRSLSAGGQYGNLASQAQGLTTDATRTGLGSVGALYDAGSGVANTRATNAQNKVNAGNYIRTYNQGVNDLIGSDILNEQNFDATKISQMLDWLKGYQSGTEGSTPAANSLTTASGLAKTSGGLLQTLGKYF